MSTESYVQLTDVREALEKVIKDGKIVEEVLDLLNESLVKVSATSNETETKETPVGEESENEPKVKQQYVILTTNPSGGWILQIPEDEDAQDVGEGIKKAAYNYNASKKGQKYPVRNIGQALSSVGARFFKPYSIKVKTKELVSIVKIENTLPTK